MSTKTCTAAVLRGLLLTAVLVPPGGAATFTVDPSGAGDFTTIQPAIDAARHGDEVVVAAGEYEICEPLSFLGKAITVRGEAGPDQTIVRMCEEPADPDLPRFVVFENGEGEASVLEGFTMTASVRESSGAYGLLCKGSSPSIRDCNFVGNNSGGDGAQFWEGSSPLLERCRIVRWGYSGVECRYESSPTFIDCVIAENSYWVGGDGVDCSHDSSPRLTRCTIVGNSGVGVSAWKRCAPILLNCIVWNNASGSFWVAPEGRITAGFSCIEGEEIWPGPGNINDQPLFCGYAGPQEVHVDAAAPGPGDGSAGDPFPDLASALGGYSLALAEDSPCRGAGRDGEDMGAETGTCATPGPLTRRVYLAAGTYTVDRLSLAHRVSIEGVGQRRTTLEGCVIGLRTGESLSDVTVTNTSGPGIAVSRAAPEITRCTIAGNQRAGVYCSPASAPIIHGCLIADNAGSGIDTTYRNDGSEDYNGAAPTVIHSTITANLRGGIELNITKLTLSSSIVWGNAGGAILMGQSDEADVSYSCVEGEEVFPGEGNINDDPLFCGWDSPAELQIESQEALADALSGFNLALASDSPSLGAGQDNSDMGADTGTCETAGASRRSLELSAGTFSLEGQSLVHLSGLSGAGAEATTIEGTVAGLREGAVLADVTVTRASRGVHVSPGESLAIARCTIRDNDDGGVFADEGAMVTLAGCRLSGNSRSQGAGLYLHWGASATLVDCAITGNSGGGISGNWSESLTLENCIVSANSGEPGVRANRSACSLTDCVISENAGGVEILYPPDPGPTIRRCTITGNRGGQFGGLDLVWCPSAIVDGCLIADNEATLDGGGIHSNRGNAVVTACEITNNRAAERGGGLFAGYTSAISFMNCRITNNRAGEQGGALCTFHSNAVGFTNCLITGNLSRQDGGGAFVFHTDTLRFFNCTIAGNRAEDLGHCSYLFHANVTLHNCIAWDNAGALAYRDAVVTVNAYYSCLEAGDVTGTGTFVSDPLFVRPGSWDGDTWNPGDYHLQPTSPCIDRGSVVAGTPSVDLDGTARPHGLRVDLGAYEFADCNGNEILDHTEIVEGTAADCDGNGILDECDITNGSAEDRNANGIPDGCELSFLRGDVNDDGEIDLSDAVSTLSWLFLAGADLGCVAATNANGDDGADLSDAVYLLAYLFLGGPAPVAPFPACGSGHLDADETLGCETPPTSCP